MGFVEVSFSSSSPLSEVMGENWCPISPVPFGSLTGSMGIPSFNLSSLISAIALSMVWLAFNFSSK